MANKNLNTLSFATLSDKYAVPQAGTTAPAMDGTAAVGSSNTYARADHVHPKDTSKQDALTFDTTPTENSTNPVTSGGINTALIEMIDDTLSVSGKAPDAAVTGEILYRGRASSTLILDSMARYTGDLSALTSPLDIPDSTWIFAVGSTLQPILGDSFTDTLGSSTGYILKKTRAGNNWRFELGPLGNAVRWIGYSVSGAAVVWNKQYPDSTLSVSGRNADAKAVGDELLRRIPDIINASNYSSSDYSNVNAINDNVVARYAADLTEEMVPGIPIYGRAWQIMTMRYSPLSVETSAGRYGRLQIAWNGVSNTEASNGVQNALAFRVSYSQTESTWRDWQFVQTDNARLYNAGFWGTSIIWGQTTDGARSEFNLPKMFARATKIPTTNNGVKGQGMITNWSTIYGSSAKADGYQFDDYDLAVLSWFGNDLTPWGSTPLGTGDDSEGTTTVLGYYNTLMKKLATNYPLMQVMWIGPRGIWTGSALGFDYSYAGGGTPWTQNDLCDGMISICERYGYAFIDMRRNNFINKYNASSIFLSDNTHFTDAGYKRFAQTVIGQIRALYCPV